MELTQLRYFQALAQSGNLTQTAKDLFISAPALSTSIARLEKDVGARLFDRVKGRMYLNDCGRLFLHSVTESLSILDFGSKQTLELSQTSGRHLSLITTNQTIWNGMIADFMLKHPEIHISVLNATGSVLKQRGILSNADLLLTGDNSAYQKEMECTPLFTDNSVMVSLPIGHPLADRSSVKLIELKNERFIFPSHGFGLNKLYYRLCKNVGFEPNVIAECSYVLMSYLHQRGFGIVFTSRRGSQFDVFSNTVTILVEDAVNDTALAQYIYWKKQSKLSTAAEAFREFALEYYR